MFKNFVESLLGILHGTPAAKAQKEKAQAVMESVKAYDQLWEFLGKMGYSKDERKAIIAQSTGIKNMKSLQDITALVEKGRVEFQIAESDDCKND